MISFQYTFCPDNISHSEVYEVLRFPNSLERLILIDWERHFEAVNDPGLWPSSLQELTLYCITRTYVETLVGFFELLPSLISLKIVLVHIDSQLVTWTRSDGQLIKTEGYLPKSLREDQRKHFRRFQPE